MKLDSVYIYMRLLTLSIPTFTPFHHIIKDRDVSLALSFSLVFAALTFFRPTGDVSARPPADAVDGVRVGNPLTCPHGHAIPGEDGSLPEVEMRPLSALQPGDDAVIGCITEEKADLLRYLASLGLLPDTPVTVESVAPFNGPLLVRVGGSQYALGREVTDKIMVLA